MFSDCRGHGQSDITHAWGCCSHSTEKYHQGPHLPWVRSEHALAEDVSPERYKLVFPGSGTQGRMDLLFVPVVQEVQPMQPGGIGGVVFFLFVSSGLSLLCCLLLLSSSLTLQQKWSPPQGWFSPLK